MQRLIVKDGMNVLNLKLMTLKQFNVTNFNLDYQENTLRALELFDNFQIEELNK